MKKILLENKKSQVPNRELKTMVESYRAKAPQEKAPESRESAIKKLDALVKDTAAKVSGDKPKTRTKAKKDPEL